MYTVKLPKIFQPFECSKLTRLGKNHDGGYLVNLYDILKTEKLVSLGIGTDCSFEEDFCNLVECDVIAFDKEQVSSSFFTDNKVLVVEPIDNDKIIKLLRTNRNIFLKCDIEGTEYEIFDSIVNYSRNLSGLVIEIHNINSADNFNELTNFISKLDQKLIHIHINNYFYYKTDNSVIPDILELTFTSSNNIKYNRDIDLPNKLDMVNNPEDREFKIIF